VHRRGVTVDAALDFRLLPNVSILWLVNVPMLSPRPQPETRTSVGLAVHGPLETAQLFSVLAGVNQFARGIERLADLIVAGYKILVVAFTADVEYTVFGHKFPFLLLCPVPVAVCAAHRLCFELPE
jgi:hypothetical protein